MSTSKHPITLAVAAFLISCGGPGTGNTSGISTPGPRPPTTADDVQSGAATEDTGPAPGAAPASVVELDTAAPASGPAVEPGDGVGLVALGSEAAVRSQAAPSLSKIRRALARQGRNRRMRRAAVGSSVGLGSMDSAADAPSAPAREAPEQNAAAAAPNGDESVTNTQVAGVDEGGIVKAWRDYLVILRRGRLFTARLGDQPGAAAPVAAIDVRPPGSRHDSWYDEMLIHAPSGKVIVIGFSYQHEATEIGLFQIAPDGSLTHRQTHLLRSNDYYSSRNYASRLVGDTLVFYMPHYLIAQRYNERTDDVSVGFSLPATRPFGGGAWHPIVESSEVYRIGHDRDSMTLHTVVTCDLSAPRFACRARGILGGDGRTFYVSQDAIYVWVTPGWPMWTDYVDDIDEELQARLERRPSYLYRLPLDGSRPSALVVRGAPIDQFSFHETSDALRVLVQAEGGGDAMWAPELTSGAVGLVTVPLSAFGRNVRTLANAAYRSLPSPTAQGRGAMQNRYVGSYLLYGTGTSWGYAQPAQERDDRVFVHQYVDGRSFSVQLSHGVDRIEAMGDDAVLVGTDGQALHFRAIELGQSPRPAGEYVRAGASQGELRSHGFFYKPLTDDEGVLGLPTRSAAEPGMAHLVNGSAEILYLSVRRLDFTPLGVLEASGATQDDRCEVSCVDWYGNARPLFYRGRVFALLGYELVEGRIDAGAIHEVARTSFLGALPPEG